MSQPASEHGMSQPASGGGVSSGGGTGGTGGGGARQHEDPKQRTHVLVMPFPYSLKKDLPENWWGDWKQRANQAGLHVSIRAMRHSFWADGIPQDTGVKNCLCVRSLSPNDPWASTEAYDLYVDFITDLHVKGKEMPELDFGDLQETDDIETDEIEVTMYGNTVYINKHKEMQAARVETKWGQFDLSGGFSVPRQRVLVHRFPRLRLKVQAACTLPPLPPKPACPLPPPPPKAACPLPSPPPASPDDSDAGPLPKRPRMEQKQDEAHEQEAALSAEATATRTSEAAEESGQSRAQDEAKTIADTAAVEQALAMETADMTAPEEFVPDFGPSTDFETELESQVCRAVQTAAEANDFLQRPDPNFLSLPMYS